MSARNTLTRAFAAPLRSLHSTPAANAAATSSASSAFGSLPPPTPAKATELPTSTTEALKLLKATTTPSTGIYCTARLHSRTYLLHPRDILTIPTLKPKQEPGTVLALTRMLEVGSRDFAIRSPAADGKELRKQLPKGVVGDFETIPSHVARCTLTVLENTKSPLTRTILKKRRKGYQKTIQNKQGWTRLRVGDIELGDGIPKSE